MPIFKIKNNVKFSFDKDVYYNVDAVDENQALKKAEYYDFLHLLDMSDSMFECDISIVDTQDEKDKPYRCELTLDMFGG